MREEKSMGTEFKFGLDAADDANRGTRGETLLPTLRDSAASDRLFVRIGNCAEELAAMSLPHLLYYVLMGEGGFTDETA
jgi:hypothetical protein